MKRALCVLLGATLPLSFTACGNKDKEVTAPTVEMGFEAETVAELNVGEAYETGDSPFSFSIESETLDFSDIQTFDGVNTEFKFSIESFDYDFAMNVSQAQQVEFGNLTNEEKQLLIEKKENFLNDLVIALGEYDINVKIDEISGEVILDSSILFATDEAEVSKEGKSVLKDFIKAYASVVSDAEHKGFINKILVEGHTDTQGSYDYNKTLSEKRAENVLEFCLSDEAGLGNSEKSLLKGMAEAVGCSYDRTVKDKQGNVDMAASRRVTFRFLINIG